MARILLSQVEKRYGKQQHYSVRDFNLDIGDHEFLVLVGPSGCGKSTTLRMIAGLEEITAGEIYIGDQLVNHLPPRERDIAMVFQNYALYPNMNVYENIAFGLRLRKMPKHEMDLAVKKAMGILEISNYQDRRPRELSGGQRQRVALGRAIVRNPQVFLMDEPLSNLDAKLRTQMRTEIIQLHKKLGVTTVYVTHDQVEAMTMGQRIVVMKDGIIQQVDTPQQVYNNPANRFVASFIGTPPINFIVGKLLENGDGNLEFHTSRFFLPVANKHADLLRAQAMINRTIVLAIRSEHLVLAAEQREQLHGSQIRGIQKIGELMGADMHLYLDIGQPDLLIVRASAWHNFVAEEALNVGFVMDKALYFDKDSGENLLRTLP